MTQRWTARASWDEAIANLSRGGVLMVVLVGLTAGIVGVGLVADVHTADRVVQAERDYLAEGGDLLVARRQDASTIDVAACVAARRLTGVTASAAVTVTPGATGVVGRPEARQTVVAATDGVLDLLGLPVPGPDDVVVSTVVADRWQWSVGSRLQLLPDDVMPGLPRGVLTVSSVADLELLSEGASTGLLVAAPGTGGADACFVRIGAQYREDVHAALPAVLGESATGAITVADRLPAGALAADPAAAYDQRPTRWVGAAAGGVVGMVWVVVAWTRRGRAALYASIGVPWSGGVVLRWVEGLGVVVPGVLWGVALAVTYAVTALGSSVALVLDVAVRGGVLACAVAAAVVLVAGLWQPATLAALKDR
ncbi:hypothetical protein [Cellulomonas phragmiteti]|uniref:ABC transporter permease n=1 Tax=Cellulomonas phragmiteti TaxID=478780 RepID=A0ABQ4DPT0_9CELL|nr:hypothetical protein [Cellulomonas phragmiteti]GIG41350.1 hypothetical protein Cph01nite_31120 [Cellulomonas phragmiteti]